MTAGIDFGLVLLAKLRGDDIAKVTQLAMEYDPEPPFNAGSPTSAGPAAVKQVLSSLESADLEMRQAVAEIGRSMNK